MILFRTKDFHLYGFTPKNPHGPFSCYGIAWKRRTNKIKDIWLHNHIRLHRKAKPIPGGIGCYTYEWESWYTDGHSASTDKRRITVKKFIRFKVGLGGKK